MNIPALLGPCRLPWLFPGLLEGPRTAPVRDAQGRPSNIRKFVKFGASSIKFSPILVRNRPIFFVQLSKYLKFHLVQMKLKKFEGLTREYSDPPLEGAYEGAQLKSARWYLGRVER